MITVENLSKSFGSRKLWTGVDFTVERGEMLALTGASGAGKSTLLNCLGLLDTVDSGAIYFDGTDITRFGRGGERRFRRDFLGYLFQNYALIDNATVSANLGVAVGARRSLSFRRKHSDYATALERVGLDGREKEAVHRLSGGEQQRVALARLLVKEPTLVLADEPTGALDEGNATIVTDLLRDLAEQGCVIVIATHNEQVYSCCDSTIRVEG